MPQVSRGSRGAGPLRPPEPALELQGPRPQVPPDLVRRGRRADERHPHAAQRARAREDRPRLPALGRARRRQDDDRPHPREGPQLLERPRGRPPARARPAPTRTGRRPATPAARSRTARASTSRRSTGPRTTRVDQVRELRESARYNPARDRFKVWIIDEVHMLSTGAFNALLKTLEEPPPQVKFIFATTEYHKIPETILSRCQQYDFRMIPARELQLHLRSVADAGEDPRLRRRARPRRARGRGQRARRALALRPGARLHRRRGEGRRRGGAPRPRRPRAAAPRLPRDRRGRQPRDARARREPGRLRGRLPQLRARAAAAPARGPAREARPRGAARSSHAILPEERERLRGLAEALSEEDLLRASTC